MNSPEATSRVRGLIAGLALLALGFGAGACSFFLPVNPLDSGNAQGLLNALAFATDSSAAAGDPAYAVGGTVAGLAGSGLLLTNAADGETVTISADGSFAFGVAYPDGTAYSVAITTQPTGPHQTCVLTGGSGTIETAHVTGISVVCTTDTFTLGGTVTGLGGTGLTIQNNGGDDLAIAADGSFTFATAVASGSTYAVTVSVQPTGPTQTCSVSGGTGTVVSGNITSVTVNCATNTYTIGGTVSGLAGTGLILRNNGGDDLSVTANGSFSFATALSSGAGYSVTVLTQPSAVTQTCVVGSGTGTVVSSNVTSVTITCTTNTYTVGGTVSGLLGGGLVLQNNAGDDLAIASDGGFAFSTALDSGTAYSVTVKTQPTSPNQTCVASTASGTVTSANITNVSITCTTTTYTVSVTVGQMSGTGMVLQNNGGDNQTINADGYYTFTAIDDGTAYSITILIQPTSPAQNCAVYNGSGTMSGANVTNVTLSCIDPQGDISGLGLWLKADAITGHTDGQSVNTWSDSSANGFSAVKSTGVNAPNYKTGILHGQPVVRFNNDHLSMDGDCLDSAGSGITIVTVVSSFESGANPKFVFDFGAYSGGGYGISYLNNTGEAWSSGATQTHFTPGKSSGQFSLVTMRIEFGNEQRLFLDGSSAGFDAGIGITAASDANCGVTTWGGGGGGPAIIGGQSKAFNASSRRLNGDIAELLWYSEALSTGDREKLECMLKTKYNLTSVSNGTCP